MLSEFEFKYSYKDIALMLCNGLDGYEIDVKRPEQRIASLLKPAEIWKRRGFHEAVIIDNSPGKRRVLEIDDTVVMEASYAGPFPIWVVMPKSEENYRNDKDTFDAVSLADEVLRELGAPFRYELENENERWRIFLKDNTTPIPIQGTEVNVVETMNGATVQYYKRAQLVFADRISGMRRIRRPGDVVTVTPA